MASLVNRARGRVKLEEGSREEGGGDGRDAAPQGRPEAEEAGGTLRESTAPDALISDLAPERGAPRSCWLRPVCRHRSSSPGNGSLLAPPFVALTGFWEQLSPVPRQGDPLDLSLPGSQGDPSLCLRLARLPPPGSSAGTVQWAHQAGCWVGSAGHVAQGQRKKMIGQI